MISCVCHSEASSGGIRRTYIHVGKSWCDDGDRSESEERKVEGERIKLQPV